MHKEAFGDKEYVIGDYDIIVDDIPARVRVFCDEVMRKNLTRRKKTSERYLTKMACALVYRCILKEFIHPELIEKILETSLECGYVLCYYRVKLFMYYIYKLKELGYVGEDPYTNYPEREFKGRYQWIETEQSILAHSH